MSFLYPESDWIFADENFGGIQLGTFLNPWSTFAAGAAFTPDNGKLWLKADSYTEYEFTGRLERPMTIESTAGSAVIGVGEVTGCALPCGSVDIASVAAASAAAASPSPAMAGRRGSCTEMRTKPSPTTSASAMISQKLCPRFVNSSPPSTGPTAAPTPNMTWKLPT